MTLWNLILEPLEVRYTEQWHRWSEKEFAKHFDNVITICGKKLTDSIEVGKVLDVNGTIHWKMGQAEEIAKLFRDGAIEDGDIFFAHDIQLFPLPRTHY